MGGINVNEFYYAQVNDENYCIGVSMLSGEIDNADYIRLLQSDESLIGRKYDRGLGIWLDEYLPLPTVTPNEHEEITRKTNNTVEVSSVDNLMNMDMLISIDEKLTKIMQHLNLQ